jgi:hypothetical protein
MKDQHIINQQMLQMIRTQTVQMDMMRKLVEHVSPNTPDIKEKKSKRKVASAPASSGKNSEREKPATKKAKKFKPPTELNIQRYKSSPVIKINPNLQQFNFEDQASGIVLILLLRNYGMTSDPKSNIFFNPINISRDTPSDEWQKSTKRAFLDHPNHKNIQFFAFAMKHESSTIVAVCYPDSRIRGVYYHIFPSTPTLGGESLDLMREIALYISNVLIKKKKALDFVKTEFAKESEFQVLMSIPSSGFAPTHLFTGDNSEILNTCASLAAVGDGRLTMRCKNEQEQDSPTHRPCRFLPYTYIQHHVEMSGIPGVEIMKSYVISLIIELCLTGFTLVTYDNLKVSNGQKVKDVLVNLLGLCGKNASCEYLLFIYYDH